MQLRSPAPPGSFSFPNIACKGSTAMEFKQLLMLTILLLSGIIGSIYVIYVLQTIDKDDENGHDDHGH
jgi:hypothetical protein